ncbi:hypothetical protein FPV67DRAFT_1485569 [Lyophyllum atratum]|nr:hypothetical protein FPV67DRAFT_1485569 [Lyophyllum atratum]
MPRTRVRSRVELHKTAYRERGISNFKRSTYTAMSTTRKVYLITYSARNGRDHWGLFIPTTFNEAKGKVIDIAGEPAKGYMHEVKHYWDSESERQKFTMHLLGETDAANVVDAAIKSDSIPQESTFTLNRADKFEDRASRLAAPGGVPAHLMPAEGSTVKETLAYWAQDIPGIKRCQEWTCELIDDLVAQEFLPQTALAVRDAAWNARRVPVV